MFGSISEWFFKWLGGIQPDPEAVGFDHGDPQAPPHSRRASATAALAFSL